MATRTRLTPEQRVEQLLDLGVELFANEPYEDVHIDRVAELAGVSRGLLYHYFPTKRAFFAALLERASRRMTLATAPDPALSPREQLSHGIDAYLEHCRANQHGAHAVYRGAGSGDADVQAIIERGTQLQQQRILTGLEPDREPHPLLVIAIRSWILFLRTACHEWIDTPDISRQEIRTLCVNTLVGALADLPDYARPARIDELEAPRAKRPVRSTRRVARPARGA